MSVLRTIFWVVVLAALAAFSVANWQPVEVRIWEGLLLETKLPALVMLAFLIGLLPTWLLYRATRWRLQRRIANLETQLTARAAPSLTSTNLEAARSPTLADDQPTSENP
ncbi:MAG: lipopolysaccharide assembly protein LapA domain-containing protein [Novosphingobium meiothermophilum]|uniref:lipopolysaccharide assembly protein LapA domain-containing protein n=1 Tax=Novosphingobium TaxID=165696 RepID=UPI000D6DED9D|nr:MULTISPECIES: LapA family protein [Novosphingobium]